jgi:pimeloyl-ACP methyl ester carboxylesterase
MVAAMPRSTVSPLVPGWIVIDGLPMFHRSCLDAGPSADTIVHVHGFGISGTYLEPAAALLAARHNTYVPDLPGMGRSMRPHASLDLQGLTRALVSYCDAVGVERATFVGNSLGCPIIIELATTFPERIERAVLVSPAGDRTTNHSVERSDRWRSTEYESRARWSRSLSAITCVSAYSRACRCSRR